MVFSIELGVRAGVYKKIDVSNRYVEFGIGLARIGVYGDIFWDTCYLYNTLIMFLTNENTRKIINQYLNNDISHDTFVNKLKFEKRKHISEDDDNSI